jgi:hypothetical protein
MLILRCAEPAAAPVAQDEEKRTLAAQSVAWALRSKPLAAMFPDHLKEEAGASGASSATEQPPAGACLSQPICAAAEHPLFQLMPVRAWEHGLYLPAMIVGCAGVHGDVRESSCSES